MNQPKDIFDYVIGEQVLNINFNTLMLLRCLPYKYAEDFLKGNIYFGSVNKWIQLEQVEGKGVGDALEGTFFSTTETDGSAFVDGLKQNSQLTHFYHEGYLYFRRKAVENMSCLCLYGIHDKEYSVSVDELGALHHTKVISAEYFSTFSEVKDREECNKLPEQERPAVVMIMNPRVFFERIKDFFAGLGCKENEVIISPVDYIDKRRTAIAVVPSPSELLLKDSYFSNQSEVRIILNLKSKKAIEYLNEHENIISIADIHDIAEIYPYYFGDMTLEKRGNQVLFTLPVPKETPFEKMSFEDLFIELLRIVKGNTIHNGILLATNKELQEYCQNEMVKVIERVHGVCVYVESKNSIRVFKTANTTESANSYFSKLSKENG